MKLLIYGAGVIGCQLAHSLMKVKSNEVTILARGEWAEVLKEKGLFIRHYLQLHTTHDKVDVITSLEPLDQYDMIFITMQQVQIPEILPVLAANTSRYLVFVGNELEAPYIEDRIKKLSTTEHEIAFGFQATGGRREDGRVISVHLEVGMTIGALDGELSHEFKKDLYTIFKGAKYRLNKEVHMDGWLKCHAAFILPVCYVCYAVDGKLRKASKEQVNAIIDAAVEAHAALKVLGYPLRPEGEEEYFTKNRSGCYKMLRIMAKTPLGRLLASDHAMHAKAEIKRLDQSFEHLRMQTNVPMPTWVKLRDACGIDEMESR